MGELIPGSALVQAIPQAVAAVQPGTPLPTAQGFNISMGDVKELLSFAVEGMKQFKEIQAMRNNQMQPQHTAQSLGPTEKAPPLPSNAPQQIVAVPQPQKEVQTVLSIPQMQVDRAKLRVFIEDVISRQADKIPQDLKERKLGDVLGANFATFSYNYNGMITVDAKTLLDLITEQMANQLDTMIVPKVAQ